MVGRKALRRRWTVFVAVFCFGLGLGLGAFTGLWKEEAVPAAGGPPDAVLPQDVRGVYVVRHALRTPQSVESALAKAAQVGANTVYLQVNGRGEAYYDGVATVKAPDVAPGFDPLAYALEQAPRYGLAVHAWINAYTAGMLVETPDDPNHVLNRHPEWVTVDRTGRSLWDYPWQEAQVHVPARMLDPGLPQVEDYVVRMVLEVAQKYPVAGIHLDYVRYPSTRFGFHPDSVGRFAEHYGFDPLALIQDAPAFVARFGRPEFEKRVGLWDAWRRDRVTALVARLRGQLRSSRPDAVFSVAVDPDPDEAVAERLQDWPRWIAEGLVDAVVPMAYSPDVALVESRIAAAVRLAADGGVPVYAALGAYMVTDDAAQLRRQMKGAEEVGAAGTILFSYDTLEQYEAVAATAAETWARSGHR